MVTAKKVEQMGTPNFRMFVVEVLLSRHAKKASKAFCNA